MDDPQKAFIPAADSLELSKMASGLNIAASDIMRAMAGLLPDDRYAKFTEILESGGRVGVETTIGKDGSRKIVLIGVRADGSRYEAGELLFVGEPPTVRT